jgi:hypothetical protein
LSGKRTAHRRVEHHRHWEVLPPRILLIGSAAKGTTTSPLDGGASTLSEGARTGEGTGGSATISMCFLACLACGGWLLGREKGKRRVGSSRTWSGGLCPHQRWPPWPSPLPPLLRLAAWREKEQGWNVLGFWGVHSRLVFCPREKQGRPSIFVGRPGSTVTIGLR